MKYSTSSGDVISYNKLFEEIFFAHLEALNRYGMLVCPNQGFIEDCIQDVFADLWERRETLYLIKTMQPYLFGCLRRKLMRKIYANKEDALRLTEMADNSGEHQGVDEQLYESRIQKLEVSLSKLTPRQREILYLRFHHQLSFQEIGQVMGIQTRAAYKLSYRAITFLRNHLKIPYTVY